MRDDRWPQRRRCMHGGTGRGRLALPLCRCRRTRRPFAGAARPRRLAARLVMPAGVVAAVTIAGRSSQTRRARRCLCARPLRAPHLRIGGGGRPPRRRAVARRATPASRTRSACSTRRGCGAGATAGRRQWCGAPVASRRRSASMTVGRRTPPLSCTGAAAGTISAARARGLRRRSTARAAGGRQLVLEARQLLRGLVFRSAGCGADGRRPRWSTQSRAAARLTRPRSLPWCRASPPSTARASPARARKASTRLANGSGSTQWTARIHRALLRRVVHRVSPITPSEFRIRLTR